MGLLKTPASPTFCLNGPSSLTTDVLIWLLCADVSLWLKKKKKFKSYTTCSLLSLKVMW